MNGQEHYLAEEDARSLEEVDYLIRKHEQFEQKINLYETKFQELLKTTQVRCSPYIRKLNFCSSNSNFNATHNIHIHFINFSWKKILKRSKPEEQKR